MYLSDLERTTEIILNRRNRVRPSAPVARERRGLGHHHRTGGSASRAAAGALRIGNTVGAALSNRRMLGPAEAGVMLKIGLMLTLLAVLGMIWPLAIAIPVGVLAAWIGLSLLVKAWRLHSSEPREVDEPPDQRRA
jgi:cardiolipin synthase